MNSFSKLSEKLEGTRLRFEERVAQLEKTLESNISSPASKAPAREPREREPSAKGSNRIEDLEVKRKRSAKFWKKWIRNYKTNKVLLKNIILQYEDDAKQISKLTADLNLAAEMNRRLRSDLPSKERNA